MLVVRILLPWHENISKRQVRKPKIYVADSGLLHTLLNLRSKSELEGHPKVGASWEGFALSQTILRLGADSEECFFWATHSGAELDLLVVRGTRRVGVEFKRTSSPKVTPSMRSAMDQLDLGELYVMHPGNSTFPMADGIKAVSINRLLVDMNPLD
jgi:predicted AAA+ superfamily ATPase